MPDEKQIKQFNEWHKSAENLYGFIFAGSLAIGVYKEYLKCRGIPIPDTGMFSTYLKSGPEIAGLLFGIYYPSKEHKLREKMNLFEPRSREIRMNRIEHEVELIKIEVMCGLIGGITMPSIAYAGQALDYLVESLF